MDILAIDKTTSIRKGMSLLVTCPLHNSPLTIVCYQYKDILTNGAYKNMCNQAQETDEMTTKKTVTTTHGRFTVDGSTSEKIINLMQAPYEKIVSVHDAETGKEIPQKSPSTILKADGSVNDSAESAGEICTIEFTEQGYNVISDARRIKIGYLHICEESADQVTDACRDHIVNYLFNHPQDLPGVGKTPQKQYFAGLSTADMERIGNRGKKAYYNQ